MVSPSGAEERAHIHEYDKGKRDIKTGTGERDESRRIFRESIDIPLLEEDLSPCTP